MSQILPQNKHDSQVGSVCDPNRFLESRMVARRAEQQPHVVRSRSLDGRSADVTLVNLNLMLADLSTHLDRQNFVPLGLLYIAACLEQSGYNVEFIDYQRFSHARAFDAELFVKTLGSLAKKVGISCMSNLLPFAIQCARAIKASQPECSVVLGGVGPSPVAREVIKAFPFVDAVVQGEGEANMLQFMADEYKPLSPPLIPENLDSLPLPAYSLLDFSAYDAAPSIITSRGCSYQCTFCTEPFNFGGQVRFRGVGPILEELELLHTLSGRSLFLFQDDTLPLNRERFRHLIEGLRKDLSFPITWKCFARVDLMDEQLMVDMAQSGCKQVRYGIESGSDQILDRIKKGFTVQKAYEVAVESLNYFPSVHASLIWGYPFETMDDFRATLDTAAKLEKAGVTVLLFQFSPLPGSPIYQELRDSKQLRFVRDNYPAYVITGHETLQPHQYQLDPEHAALYQLIDEHPDIFPGFYEYACADIEEKREALRPFAAIRKIRNQHDL